MDPILAQSTNYFTNSSLTNETAELSDLFALPEPFQTVLAILYGGTASIAFITNISAVIILVKKMKTSADLRKYLINLSAADLSMAIFSVPFNYTDVMYGYWKFPLFMCPFSRFMSIFSICNSIFTLTAIGIERYRKFFFYF
jgi:leucokinin receptor/neuropeptide Y receptor